VLQRSVEALDRVNRLLSDSNLKTVTGMLEDIHSVTGELRERKAIIADAQHALQSMDITLQKVGQLSDSAKGLVDGDAKKTLQNLAAAADDLKQTSQKAQQLLGKLEGPTTDFATNGLPQLTATLGSLQTATDSLNRVLSEAERSPGALVSKPPAKEIEVKP
jgi:phospholipid/cholesterol/gamma-HCH transport system substrate-binding protein